MEIRFLMHVYVRLAVIAGKINVCYTVHGTIGRAGVGGVMMILKTMEMSMGVGRYGISLETI